MAWAPERAVGSAATRTEGEAAPGPHAAPPGVRADSGAGLRDTPGLTALETLRLLESGPRGLTEAQAEERLLRYGDNTAPERRPPGRPWRFVRSLRDPFTTVLLCLALVSAAVASWGTACVIAVLVVVSAVLRSSGEYRAERSTAALRELIATTATVQRRAAAGSAARAARAGRPSGAPKGGTAGAASRGVAAREIPVDQLVPGDVIRLGPGDLVPADLRLLRASGLTVRQAPLTGESAPVAKYPVEGPGVPGVPEGRAGGTHAAEGAGAAVGAGRTAASGAGLFERPELCFQGSSVASGSATAVVLATGADTVFAGTYRQSPSPGTGAGAGAEAGAEGRGRRRRPSRRPRESAFDRSVNGVSWILIRFMLLTPPLVLMANAALRGRGLETLPFAVAVAVGLTPEMLPVIVTTALARGAALLARGGEVIVKRLPALHDLGAIDVLCTDKTGTLTQDRPVLDCSLDPEGRPAPEPLHWAAVNSLWTLQLAELPTPDALDEAILEAAEDDFDELLAYEGVAALPFDPARRTSCAVVRTDAAVAGWSGFSGPGPGVVGAAGAAGAVGALGRHTLVVKGAPEAVLERCARVRTGGQVTEGTDESHDVYGSHGPHGLHGPGGTNRPNRPNGPEDIELDDAVRARLSRLVADRTADGLRLLAVAVAERPARPSGRPYTPADERGLTLVGFVGLRDALAPTAAEACAGLARRGVTVKVLTGDHPGTVTHVCRELGLDTGPGAVITADRIDGLTDTELARLAARTTAFARCTPEHKARIVEALRAGAGSAGRARTERSDGTNASPGEPITPRTVGFLGDGVNDLPALHACDVGIAPRDAVDVTREAADVVLASKDLSAIDGAIVTGRSSSANIATYLRITLSSNLGNVIAMLGAGLLLPFLPMLPAQVLVQNLCFDAVQLAFAFDRPGPAALRRPAALRPADLLRYITGFGLLNAAADLATFGVLVLAVHGSGHPGGQDAFHAGWFTENLLTQALVMYLLRTGRRSAEGRAPGPIRIAVCALAVIGLLLPPSPLGPLLGMAALPPLYYGLLAAVLVLYGAGLAWAKERYDRNAAEEDPDLGPGTGPASAPYGSPTPYDPSGASGPPGPSPHP
ncbi:cation-transporting P-type ATPase [Streptomyces sp. NPDC018045]|uniref:P-type ATPase n=1 Tax=Streptomyces sp. NPDC018045 TaxID=3365037 RepID=UPI00378BD311